MKRLKFILIPLALILALSLFIACSKNDYPTAPGNTHDTFHIDSESCIACGKCYDACPHNAIRFNLGKPVIDQARCERCAQCVGVCPTGAIQ